MRKSGVIPESDDASKSRCASSDPMFILTIRLCRFCDGVIETVVPGQTRNSPPLDKLSPCARFDWPGMRFQIGLDSANSREFPRFAIDRGDLPAAFGQPERVAALS